MKLKKVQNSKTLSCRISIELESNWKIIESDETDLLRFLGKSLSEIQQNYKLVSYDQIDYQDALPFQPIAYRDFMLYEQHAIDAARGFVKKYMPYLFPIVNTFEKITKRSFPKLKPSKRYYQYPIYYLGNHLNFITHQQNIAIPVYTKELDYELEIAAIITKPLKNATVEEALDAISGFAILNDFSARDVQLDEIKTGFGPMKTKNFGTSISSVVVSKDEIVSYIDDLKVKVFINDEFITESSTKNKLFSFQKAIAFASWEEQLHAGEIFGSGTIPTCTGIENGRMLKKGDLIRLEVDKMGILSNTVI